MQKITIAGGGLAGLACGIRLRQLGVEVELHERKSYPLKKVCGEFLSPLGWRRCQELGIEGFLERPPVALARARFYYSESAFFDFELGPAAWGLSRAALDTALARRFTALGGELREGSSLESADIQASGRPSGAGKGSWMGWKGYLEAADAPEALMQVQMLMLPIRQGYCGLSPVEDGRISVCFVARAPASPEGLLGSHPLLAALAPRIRPHASIAGFDFTAQPGPGRAGDARRVWPPLVGDGMSRALGAGMALAEGREEASLSQSMQFGLSKAAHSLMLFQFTRSLAGPLCELWPRLPAAFYRFSRG